MTTDTADNTLGSWNDTSARQTIVDFVEKVTREGGPDFVPRPERVAVCAGGRARPGLRLLLLHDDPEREFEYTEGAEKSLERANQAGWTVVSIKNDWSTVFTDSGG